eukprot:1922479-Alexandrium_andersonii.AAC.1
MPGFCEEPASTGAFVETCCGFRSEGVVCSGAFVAVSHESRVSVQAYRGRGRRASGPGLCGQLPGAGG